MLAQRTEDLEPSGMEAEGRLQRSYQAGRTERTGILGIPTVCQARNWGTQMRISLNFCLEEAQCQGAGRQVNRSALAV